MNCAGPRTGGRVSTVNTTALHGPWWVDSAGEEEVQTRSADYKLQVLSKVQVYPYCLCTHCVPTAGWVVYGEAVGCGQARRPPGTWPCSLGRQVTPHPTQVPPTPSPHLCSQQLLLRHPEPVQAAGSHSPQLPTPVTKPSWPSIHPLSLH